MATIVSCECGAKIRLPEQTANRQFRCPQCKTGIALTVDARVLASSRLAAGAGATCPICQSPIAAQEFVVTCPKCDQIHHRECWAEVGGCGTYGCEQAPAQEKAPAQQPLSAWGDTKKCPVCGETIKAIAVKCRYCGTDFGTVDPVSLRDLHRKSDREDTASWLKKFVVILFVLSVLAGCLAPILAVVGLAVLVPRRQDLARAEPLFQVLAYSAVIVSLVYSFLMVLLALV